MINPYKNIDFNSIVVLPAISHEHTYSQEYFQNCWNRGIRIIPIVHYGPAVPRYPIDGWTAEYEDYTDETGLVKATRTETGAIADFVDNNGDTVDVSELPSLPNAERVNLSDYPNIHLCSLGSTFGDPGWSLLPGNVNPTGGIVAWRSAHPVLTFGELLTSIEANKLYDDIFLTLNHPTEVENTYLRMLAYGKINAVEAYNNGYTDEMNQTFRNKIDNFLRAGYRFWLVASTDWQGDYPVDSGRTEDLGCNVLLLDPNYNSMSKIDKEKEILSAYMQGRFYASGKRTIGLSSLTAGEGVVSLTLSETVPTLKIITDSETIELSNVSNASYNIKNPTIFVRFEAFSGTDFLFTNPIFFNKNNNRHKRIILSVL